MDTLKLRLNGGNARSNTALGPSLGQKGVPLAEFVSQYDNLTASYDPSCLLGIKVKIKNRKFIILPGFMSTSLIVKKIIFFKKLSPNLDDFVQLTFQDLYSVMLIKMKDPRYNNVSPVQMLSMVLGTARSLHVSLDKTQL